MSIVQKIRKSVTDILQIPCYYHSAEELNTLMDNATYPCAMFFLLTGGTVAQVGKVFRERVTFAMFFVDKTEFDFSSKENEKIIQQCKERAAKWLKSLIGSHTLHLVGTEATERIYDYFDVQLTGYGVRVTVEELEGECLTK